MKGTIVVLTAAALMVAMIAGVAPVTSAPAGYGAAAQGQYANASKICKQFNDFGLGSHGACVRAFTSDNSAAAIAQACKDPLVQEFFGVTNRGQCVKAFKEFMQS